MGLNTLHSIKWCFVAEGTFMKVCEICISYELTLHLPWEVHFYKFVAS